MKFSRCYYYSPSICLVIDKFIPPDGIARLPIADEDDNADAANCGKPADTYAAARFGSVPIVESKYGYVHRCVVVWSIYFVDCIAKQSL